MARATRGCRSSTIDRRDRAVVCVCTFNGLVRHPLASRTLEYLKTAWAVRSISGCFEAMLVASGRAEAWIELEASSWDLAALQVIAEEAGARFFNFDGGRSPHARQLRDLRPGLRGGAPGPRGFPESPVVKDQGHECRRSSGVMMLRPHARAARPQSPF